MNNFMPPPTPSADSIQAAHSMIALIVDAKGAKQRLDELVAAHDQIRQAHGELQVERKRLVDENARAADLRAKENLLAGKQTDLEKGALAQAVAAGALQEREQKLLAAEAALNAKQKAHAEKEAALNAKLVNMRSALAG